MLLEGAYNMLMIQIGPWGNSLQHNTAQCWQNFGIDLVTFRGKMKLKNFQEYEYWVAYDIDGNMITYDNRKCDELWAVPKTLE
jgi:hypothetical protein